MFLPLPVIAYGCVAWVLATRLSLDRARRLESHAISGPGMQALTMFLLVVPLVSLTMLAVNALQVDAVWIAVSGVVVGILFGSAVSEPLRRFMLDLANLSGREYENGTKTE